MKLCVISYKGCWQDGQGKWYSTGGFPLQISAIAHLFDGLTLVSVETQPGAGGIPFPENTQAVMLRQPQGQDFSRKLSTLGMIPYYIREIGEVIRQSDVVHVPVPGDIPFIGFILALVMQKRLIVRYASSWEVTSRTTAMNRVTKNLMRWFAGGRNVMLATGMGDRSPAPAVHWLFSSAIPEAEIQRVHPDFSRQPGKPFQLAYAGRLSVEKGVIYLLRALAILRDKKFTERDFHLTLIGEGPLMEQFQAYIEEQQLQPWVTFTGQVSRTVLTQILTGMDVAILPSLTESFCKARLDAMLCGVPVITTEVGFGREIVGKDGERGWIVPVGDAQALAGQIDCIAHEPLDWQSLRERCRDFAEGFTLDQWAAEIGQICSQQWQLPVRNGKFVL